jgi:hypothetical protein
MMGGCCNYFAELCALSTAGELTTVERGALDRHLRGCAGCAQLLAEYERLANEDFPQLAATPMEEETGIERYHAARERLISRLRSRRAFGWLAVPAAIVMVLCVGTGYEFGHRAGMRTHPGSSPPPQATLDSKRPTSAMRAQNDDLLRSVLARDEARIRELDSRARNDEQRIEGLTQEKAALVHTLEDAVTRIATEQQEIAMVGKQPADLQRRIDEAAQTLSKIQTDLTQAKEEREQATLRTASLEAQIKDLNELLAVSQDAARKSEEFLRKNRDIREIMGARQLYIADVFDVNPNGTKSKPFGRVFYTAGKFLVFYAFDLDGEARRRERQTFQAWGRPEKDSGHPISLGMFYMDNQDNRRWVLKSEDPDVLATINAVFVTVEPKGGSDRPTTKPFLYAYLRSLPPNHF